jgi:hypothetical protein
MSLRSSGLRLLWKLERTSLAIRYGHHPGIGTAKNQEDDRNKN